MDRIRVMLLFGGESSEHDVSVSSARNVYAAIDNEKFDVILGYIDFRGKWWLLESFDEQIITQGAAQLLPTLGSKGFLTLPEQRIIQPDVVLPILHGRNGEDGSVQGLLRLLHIPFVGCDMTASAIGMDKVAAKEIAAMHGMKVVPYKVHHISDAIPDFQRLTMTLGCPVFVKPARAGSSVGVSKVYSDDEFHEAIKAAHEHDTTVLIEQAITARELEVAMLGTPPRHRVSDVGEIMSSADFYSYDDKYKDGTSSTQIPAEVDDAIRLKIKDQAKRLYRAIGGSGLARVDFFLDEDGVLYFNEVNTLPGFTNISMYPKLWRHEGVSYPELIERLVTDALERNKSVIIDEKE